MSSPEPTAISNIDEHDPAIAAEASNLVSNIDVLSNDKILRMNRQTTSSSETLRTFPNQQTPIGQPTMAAALHMNRRMMVASSQAMTIARMKGNLSSLQMSTMMSTRNTRRTMTMTMTMITIRFQRAGRQWRRPGTTTKRDLRNDSPQSMRNT